VASSNFTPWRTVELLIRESAAVARVHGLRRLALPQDPEARRSEHLSTLCGVFRPPQTGIGWQMSTGCGQGRTIFRPRPSSGRSVWTPYRGHSREGLGDRERVYAAPLGDQPSGASAGRPAFGGATLAGLRRHGALFIARCVRTSDRRHASSLPSEVECQHARAGERKVDRIVEDAPTWKLRSTSSA
jgi:hypothetical protein